MASNEKTGRSRGKATIEDVLLAVAETQRTMAEALRAMSQGQPPATRTARSAPAEEPILAHKGQFEWGKVDPDDSAQADELVLVEDGTGARLSVLGLLGDQTKRIQINFDASNNANDVAGVRSDDVNDTVNALTSFLSKRLVLLGRGGAQCDK